MGKQLFNNYINLIIADSSISVCNTTDFSSYRTFSDYISSSIKSKSYSNIERYVLPIVNDLSNIMGIPVSESALHITKFFKEKKWETYNKPILDIREEFSIFLVP